MYEEIELQIDVRNGWSGHQEGWEGTDQLIVLQVAA